MPENKTSDTAGIPPLRRPLLGIVFLYLAGTCAGVWIGGVHFQSILALAFVTLIAAFGLHKAGSRHALFLSIAGGCLFLAVFFAGWLAADLRINSPSQRHISALMQRPREGVEIIGLVASDPQLRRGGAEDRQSWSFAMEVEAVSRLGFFQRARGEVLVNMPHESCNIAEQVGRGVPAEPSDGGTAHPSYGELWQLNGALIDRAFDSSRTGDRGSCLIGKAFNKVGPDSLVGPSCGRAAGSRPWRGKQGCLPRLEHGSALPSETEKIYRRPDLLPNRFMFQADRVSGGRRLAAASPFDLLHWCFRLRQKCSAILARGIDHEPDVVGILNALVLGRQSELPFELREAFMATGTYHIFAISGQHVAILALFVVAVLQVYGVCRVQWFYYLAPVLVVFTLMTGMSASAVRGCLMALLCFLGPLFLRRPDISSAMALAALIIVGADPRQLFQAGFLLSFGIVAGLIVLCPPLIAVADKMTGPDPYRLEMEGLGRRRARAAARWLVFMVIASMAAWAVSTPLIARWFNLVSPIAIIANLCVIPLATLVLLAGCLAIVFGWWCPLVAEAFNFTNVGFVSLMADITLALARVPFGHVFVKSPPLWFVGLWLAVLVVWRLYYRSARIWLAAVLILLLAGLCAWLVQKKEWEIHVLNIDRSAVCLVKASGDNILLNCGPRYRSRDLLRYLRKNGVNRIRTVFCPRPDALHAGAAPEISAAFRVDEIRRGSKRFETDVADSRNSKQVGTDSLSVRPQKERRDKAVPPYLEKSCWRPDLTGKVTVRIEADENAPLAMSISLNDVSAPVTVEVEEQEMAGAAPEDHAAGSNTHFRVVCRAVNEERNQDVASQTIEFQSSAKIDLGPGRGVVISPDKNGIEIRSVSLGR